MFFKREGRLDAYKVEAVRIFKEFYIVRLEGVESISQTEEFVGSEAFVAVEDLPPLVEGEYYFHEIEGFSVVTLEGREVGRVTDLIAVPGSDLLVVVSGGREILVPLVGTICLEFDLQNRRLVIDPPDGILDLNEI
ncbi:MAG: ribosome maturation factor RimM [Candidatus Aminicenantaceae bacterium]